MNQTDKPISDQAPLTCLAGGGAMGALMRSLDWSKTPLGPVESWSPTLQMTVRTLLVNRFPLLLWWGPQYIQLYNDAYRPIPGAKHPKSMGQPARECWPEIWHVIGPLIDTPFHGGPATWMEDIFLEVNRHGFVEETHFTIAYSPVPDDTVPGGIGGVLGTVHEITEKVVGERRMVALRDLGTRPAESKTAEEACAAAAKTLAVHGKDVPFALCYLTDPGGEHARLAGAAGVPIGEAISPPVVDLDAGDGSGWPLVEVKRTEELQIVADLGARFPSVPRGPWSDPPHTAVVLPIRSNKAHELAGFLVAGVSARLRFDDAYRGFLELATTQVATAIANARAYEEEKQRAEALAELDRAKTAFFSNVSHEFRTPLTLMLGPVEDMLSRSYTELSPAAKGQLEVVNRNGLRLLRLVNTLLDFSRIEAGRAQAVYQPTDLAAFTAELASVFRAAVERAGLRLAVDCPALAEPVFVDRDMWEKVVLNLLSNALKFTFEGEIAVSLRQCSRHAPRDATQHAERADYVELRVRDTGTGIPAEEMPRLFERFHRVWNARGRTHEGSGIGLALVQELVKLHGGAVTAESTLGRGTTFTVTVPLGSAHLPPEQIGSRRTLASTATGASPYVEEALRWLPSEEKDEGGRMKDEGTIEDRPIHPSSFILHPSEDDRPRVLVADDNADMRQYVTRLLAEHFRIEAVPDGEAALAAARERPPDLILTDVMMPRLDGFGLLREVRAGPRTRCVPVIMLSARAGEESRVEGMEAGADDYLVKPFSARELVTRVSAHLQMVRLRRETNERIIATLESLTDGFLRLDRDWRIVYMNPEYERQCQRPRADQLSKVFWEEWPANIGTPLEAEFRRAMAERVTVQFENYYAPFDRWFDIKADPTPDDGLAVFCRDIDDQKRVERQLRESEERFRLIVESARDFAIFTVDPTGNITGWNSGARNLLSYDEAEIVGRPSDVVYTPEDREQNIPARELERARTDGRADNERWHIRKDGSRFWASGLVMPMQDGGNVVGFVNILRDRTEGRLAEERLREAEVQFRTLADNMSQFAWMADEKGWIFWYNRRWYEYTGTTLEQMQGWGWKAVHHPDHVNRVVERVQRSWDTGEFWEDTFPLRGVDGSYRWFLSRAVPIRDGAGRIVRWFGTNTDITEQRELAQALKEADRKKDEFLSILAHELRNPLAPLRNGLQLMKLAQNDANAVEQARTMMERQLGQMVRLIDDLMDLTRISLGKIVLRKTRMPLASAVRNAVETSRPLIEQAGHDLTLDVPDDPIYVDADETRLSQVFANLLNNAAKYTDRGGRIRLTVERQGGAAVVTVEDNGVGIPAHMLPRVFDMFTQVDRSLEKSQGGLGIGLNIVKRLAEMHGGSIEAHSGGHGMGSRFVVRLPVVPAPASDPPGAEAVEQVTHAARCRILVVDDNRDAAITLAMMLKILGNDTQTAHDGLEAVDVAATFRPDVILLDIGMPKLNGYDACRRIRQEPWGKNLVLVALTGWGQEEDRQRSQEAGFNFHLVKPVDPAALEKLLAELQTGTG